MSSALRLAGARGGGGELLDHDPTAAAVEDAVRQLLAAAADSGPVELPSLLSVSPAELDVERETLRLFASLVRRITPRHVVELGCGPSTELLAQLGFEHGRMAVTTIEHDPWAAEARMMASGAQAMNYRWFSFCICPLVARRCGAVEYPVYDDKMAQPTVPYRADLVIINGPPEVLGGRGGTIYQALRYARPGAIVLLLDVRDTEGAVVERWLRDLEEHIEFMPPGLLRRHLAFVVLQTLSEPFVLEMPAGRALSRAVATSRSA